MTFENLDTRLQTRIEQLAFDAGCSWIEEFRDERGREPEPEECDEQSVSAAERLQSEAVRLLQNHGVEVSSTLVASVRRALEAQFVNALDM